MPEIKTRDAVKGTIKTLDKAAIAGDRMKQVFVRTKDKAENSISASEYNPEVFLIGLLESVSFFCINSYCMHFAFKVICLFS